MLKLPAMLARVSFLFWIFSLLAEMATFSAQISARIDTPRPGEALQGSVWIEGSTGSEGFQSAEVSFAYEGEANNWFLIGMQSQPVKKGSLAVWDTTTIADGTYRLRLVVQLAGGRTEEVIVEGLRVRNYTPVETLPAATAAATRPADTAQPPTPAPAVLLPTSSPQPANPAEVTQFGLGLSVTQGIIYTLVLFLLTGIYLGLRSISRGR